MGFSSLQLALRILGASRALGVQDVRTQRLRLPKAQRVGHAIHMRYRAIGRGAERFWV